MILPLGSKLLFHLFIFRIMQMGVIRHKVKKGPKSRDMGFLHGHVHIPGKGGATLNRPFLLQTRNSTKVIHIVSYTQHTPLFS